MRGESPEKDYREYLETLSLMSLRVLGRHLGVGKASALNKDSLVQELVSLLTSKANPAPRTNRGAPPKQTFIDPSIIKQIERIRQDWEDIGSKKDFVPFYPNAETPSEATLEVRSGEYETPSYEKPVYSGILEITPNGYGFLRGQNCQPTSGKDVFVSAPAIHAARLREGDFVVCTVTTRQQNGSPAMDKILSVNLQYPGQYENRPHFDDLTAQYPCRKINLSKDDPLPSLRVLDLFVPIGNGQRALIIAPPKAGKTTLIKEIANAIGNGHRNVRLMILLIDERPEEVTDIRSSVYGAEVIYSTFDEGAEHHVRAAELAIQHAKRMVEQGLDVVLLLDSLTKLTRAYNSLSQNSGKTLSGGLEASALAEPKRFFGAARNTVEAGSLTILATVLVDTGSRMDDVIYEEFKGTGNADIFLSRELAERRIFPAIDIRRSGTRKEELLLTKDELNAVYRLRERGITEQVGGVIDSLKRTKDNGEFISRLPEWLKIFKNV